MKLSQGFSLKTGLDNLDGIRGLDQDHNNSC